MFIIIHTPDDVSQKCHFMRRVNIIPQLKRYLHIFLDVPMESITLILTTGHSVRTIGSLNKRIDRGTVFGIFLFAFHYG